jgi:hypothetical protein
MAAPRPKKTTVKKTKPPVKKKPSFLKKDTPRPARDVKPGDLRSQTLANDNTPRPAKDLNKGGLREQFLKNAKGAASRTLGTILRTGLKRAGPVGALVSMTQPAGTGSTVPGQAQKAVEKKMKREIRQGPKLAVTGVKEGTTRRLAPTGSRKPAPGANYTPKKSSGFGKRISESAKFERLRATRAALGSKSSDSGSLRKAGAGTYTAPYDVKAQKSGPSNTAATTAASGSNGGGSQAANVAKAGGKAKVGRQTRYQRESLAMEQKRSSGKPKKSIFSLFRKG